MNGAGPVRVYDPSNPVHLAWWMDEVRRQIEDAVDPPESVTATWPRRCASEACDEYDGIHSYGDGCALVGQD